MFSPKQFKNFSSLILITLAFFLSNCSKDENEETVAVDCCSSGSGIIKGTVLDNASDALSGVSVTFAKSGTTSSAVTTVDTGTYSKTSLSSGTYTLTYPKSGYIETSQSATLTADDETLEVATVTILANSCSAGTVSGTITDAVTGANVNNASINVRSGLNVTSGSTTGGTTTTATNGTYTLSSMSAGGYTVQASKSGYISTFNTVYVCGNLTNQDASMSEELSSGTMRIVLSWPSGSTADDLDSHLSIPNSAGNGTVHIYYGTTNYIYGANDNVTLDNDADESPGTVTITISQVRSGTYRYSVADYDHLSSASSTVLSKSGASVKVYYNNTTTTFNVPNSAGALCRVFTFTTSGGLIASGNMSSASNSGNVY